MYAGTAAGEVVAMRVDATGHPVTRGRVDVGRPVAAVAADRENRYVYAATESGEVIALAVRPRKGALAIVDRASARGAGTADLAVYRSGKYVFAANERSGGVSVLPVRQLGGFTPGDGYPAGAGPRAVVPHPALDFVLVVSAGARTVAQFAFAMGTGILTPSREPPLVLPPKTVPRDLAFHPSGRWAYLLAEDASVVGFGFEPTSGTLSVLSFGSVATLPAETKRGQGVDLVAAPGGRALYVLRRGHDGVAVVALDSGSGTFGPVSHDPPRGERPRALAIDSAGSTLAVAYQGSGAVVVLQTDPTTGAITSSASASVRGGPVAVAVASR